jgi:hypothetical protein
MKPEYPDRDGLDHHGTGGGHQDKSNRISRVVLPVRVAKSTFAIDVRRKVIFVRFDRLPAGDHGMAERRVIVTTQAEEVPTSPIRVATPECPWRLTFTLASRDYS